MKLLHIDSSITGEKSISRQLSRSIVDKLTQENPAIEVTYYNLNEMPLSHLSSVILSGQEETEKLLGESILHEFMEADILVIGAPMYNFSIPSQLKAWIDRIMVAGKTFRYTAEGPVGLAGGKRVIVASVRGGFYSAGSVGSIANDHQETLLSSIFGMIGITDITFIRAEGVNTGADNAATALQRANSQISALNLAVAA